jgi:DNA-binding MarR family transcriptional regulator
MVSTTAHVGELERELVAVFTAFGSVYRRWIGAQTRGDGMTYPRMRVLQVLSERGPSIMCVLSDELCVTARGVTSLVDGLEAEGLVRRQPHPTDRRATLVDLTDAGREWMRERFEVHAEHAAALFAKLDPDDQRTLLRIVHELIEALQQSPSG